MEPNHLPHSSLDAQSHPLHPVDSKMRSQLLGLASKSACILASFAALSYLEDDWPSCVWLVDCLCIAT